MLTNVMATETTQALAMGMNGKRSEGPEPDAIVDNGATAGHQMKRAKLDNDSTAGCDTTGQWPNAISGAGPRSHLISNTLTIPPSGPAVPAVTTEQIAGGMNQPSPAAPSHAMSRFGTAAVHSRIISTNPPLAAAQNGGAPNTPGSGGQPGGGLGNRPANAHITPIHRQQPGQDASMRPGETSSPRAMNGGSNSKNNAANRTYGQAQGVRRPISSSDDIPNKPSVPGVVGTSVTTNPPHAKGMPPQNSPNPYSAGSRPIAPTGSMGGPQGGQHQGTLSSQPHQSAAASQQHQSATASQQHQSATALQHQSATASQQHQSATASQQHQSATASQQHQSATASQQHQGIAEMISRGGIPHFGSAAAAGGYQPGMHSGLSAGMVPGTLQAQLAAAAATNPLFHHHAAALKASAAFGGLGAAAGQYMMPPFGPLGHLGSLPFMGGPAGLGFALGQREVYQFMQQHMQQVVQQAQAHAHMQTAQLHGPSSHNSHALGSRGPSSHRRGLSTSLDHRRDRGEQFDRGGRHRDREGLVDLRAGSNRDFGGGREFRGASDREREMLGLQRETGMHGRGRGGGLSSRGPPQGAGRGGGRHQRRRPQQRRRPSDLDNVSDDEGAEEEEGDQEQDGDGVEEGGRAQGGQGEPPWSGGPRRRLAGGMLSGGGSLVSVIESADLGIEWKVLPLPEDADPIGLLRKSLNGSSRVRSDRVLRMTNTPRLRRILKELGITGLKEIDEEEDEEDEDEEDEEEEVSVGAAAPSTGSKRQQQVKKEEGDQPIKKEPMKKEGDEKVIHGRESGASTDKSSQEVKQEIKGKSPANVRTGASAGKGGGKAAAHPHPPPVVSKSRRKTAPTRAAD